MLESCWSRLRITWSIVSCGACVVKSSFSANGSSWRDAAREVSSGDAIVLELRLTTTDRRLLLVTEVELMTREDRGVVLENFL